MNLLCNLAVQRSTFITHSFVFIASDIESSHPHRIKGLLEISVISHFLKSQFRRAPVANEDLNLFPGSLEIHDGPFIKLSATERW